MKTHLSLFAAALLLVACSKKEADPPALAQTASINLDFDYYATSFTPAETISVNAKATDAFGKVLPDQLMLRIESVGERNNYGDSRVDFLLPASRQKAGVVGSYALASQPDASLGDALVTLTRPYEASGVSSNLYTSSSNRLTGMLIITRYDATRRLVSGSFRMDTPGVKDPFAYDVAAVPGDIRRVGDLHLRGEFEEIPLR